MLSTPDASPAMILAETPWWFGILFVAFLVGSWIYSTILEIQARKQEQEEAEARRRAKESGSDAEKPKAEDIPWQPVVVDKQLSDALGRRQHGDVVTLPAPPPRRRIEPSPQTPGHRPPPQRKVQPSAPPVAQRTPPSPPPLSVPTASSASSAGSRTEQLSRGAAETEKREAATASQPALILTELDRLRAKNAATPPPLSGAGGTPRVVSTSRPALTPAPASANPTHGLAALLRDKNSLRQAFLLKEVLGTPRGLSSDL